MLVVADMDGTLTESRQIAEKPMMKIICRILKKHFFCIISGASYKRIKIQILDLLPAVPDIKNLYVVAQSGAEIWGYSGLLCKKDMHENAKTLVKMLLRGHAAPRAELLEKYGIKIGASNPLIVDKGNQITFSIAGVNTDIEIKKRVDPDTTIRKGIVDNLKPFLPPGIEMAIGGTTSIDFTTKGVDKRFGVQYLQKHLRIGTADIIYIGDKCFKGGNDWIGEKYNYRNVGCPAEALKILEKLA